MALTFRNYKSAVPIAKCQETQRIVYLLPDSECFPAIAKKNITAQTYKCPYCKKDFNYKSSLIHHVSVKGVCPKKGRIHMETMPFIELNDEVLFKLPLDDHELIFVTGAPKSGKTYWTNEFVKRAIALYKKKAILITRLNEDETLKNDEKLYTRIVINPELLIDKFTLEDFNDSIVIFDDIESSEYKKVTEYLYDLLSDMAKNGRHHNITIIFTNQMAMMYKRTREILSMLTTLVIFPNSGSAYHMRRLLRTYIGLEKAEVDKVLGLKSRWVSISREKPQYVMYEGGVYLLGADSY